MADKRRPYLDQSARCACGAVTVAVRGEALLMLLCACEDCQKASGAGHSAVISVSTGDVVVTGPTRSFSRPADSGAVFTRHFCPDCGTPVFGSSSRAPQLALLPVGLFGADASWFAPRQLIFARSHRDWDVVAEALPRYETYRRREAAATGTVHP